MCAAMEVALVSSFSFEKKKKANSLLVVRVNFFMKVVVLLTDQALRICVDQIFQCSC